MQNHERRRHPRFSCSLQAYCQASEYVDYGPSWPASIVNLSQTGACFHVTNRVPFGTQLAIHLELEDGSQFPTLHARVLRAEAIPGEGWQLGCVFTRPLSRQGLALLLQISGASASPPQLT